MTPTWVIVLSMWLFAALAGVILMAGVVDETLEEKRNEEIGGRRHGRR